MDCEVGFDGSFWGQPKGELLSSRGKVPVCCTDYLNDLKQRFESASVSGGTFHARLMGLFNEACRYTEMTIIYR